MAAFVKFEEFTFQLLAGKHNLLAANDVVKVMLTNTAPVAADALFADIVDIGAGNGYTAGGDDIQNDVTETPAGTGNLTGVDVTFTASSGTIGPFRYAVIYNDTQATPAKPLIGFWDYLSNVTLQDTETFKVDFGATILQLV